MNFHHLARKYEANMRPVQRAAMLKNKGKFKKEIIHISKAQMKSQIIKIFAMYLKWIVTIMVRPN